MRACKLLINGHFRQQRITGVQRYGHEIIAQFDKKDIPYSWVLSPKTLPSDVLRQLWMQSFMPLKVPKGKLLWSPTNIGPVLCENQVLTLHDIADQIHPEWFDDKYVQWRKIILPRLLKRVRRIITVSHFSRASIIERFPQTQGKIEVIYNGVCTNHFYPRSEDEINILKRTLNLQKPFVLSVGSFDSRKNLNGLIKAWQMLPGWVHKEMDLVIAGAPAPKFSFRHGKNYKESVRFIGYVNDEQLPALYSAAQIFVYPSLFEGFGLPVLEAMACSTAVVTSNTTSLKELADHRALSVSPHEPEAIAEAVKTLLERNIVRKQYAAKGQNYANTFGWDKTAVQTKKVLEACLE